MENFKITVVFSDGEVVTEKFCTEVGAERALRWWHRAAEADRANGETYTIVSSDLEEIHCEAPEEELV